MDRVRRAPDARYHRLDFTTKRPADADVIGFADSLSRVFGSRRRAVASILRATHLYHDWRRTVEQCPVCNAFIPVPDYGADHMTRIGDHESVAGTQCRGSGQGVRWEGDAATLNDMLSSIAKQQNIELTEDPFIGAL